MKSRMFPDPSGSPLTGPLTLTGPIAVPTIPADGPAHWHPQWDEPVYAEMYHQHRDRLLTGLLAAPSQVTEVTA